MGADRQGQGVSGGSPIRPLKRDHSRYEAGRVPVVPEDRLPTQTPSHHGVQDAGGTSRTKC